MNDPLFACSACGQTLRDDCLHHEEPECPKCGADLLPYEATIAPEVWQARVVEADRRLREWNELQRAAGGSPIVADVPGCDGAEMMPVQDGNAP